MLRIGMFLQDRYEILEKIGSGGMSDVYKARCHKLNRLVAVKVLKEEFSEDINFVGKFRMEAQAAAGLSHPNIVNVYDVIDEGDIHAIVMELIEGIVLKSYIAKKGKLEVRESIGIAIQVAQGISAAHERHIIHRDIKSQNMIISKDGKVKVADFGIARAISSQTIGINVMGSVHYISPEQARGNYSDERSDIYSLGITMYEMVTGRLPFEGDSTVAVALAHLESRLVPPSLYAPDIPGSLEQIIMKCTEKKPERRYSNVTELIADLRKSLMNPEEDFVQPVPVPSEDAQTIAISERERAEINRQAAAHREQEYNRRELVNEVRRKKSIQDNTPMQETSASEDVSPKFEKLFAAAGVVAAIIIVAVMIFIFVRLGGIFNQTSPKVTTGAFTTGEVNPSGGDETDANISTTQSRMPSVIGLKEEDAEARLKEHTITAKWKQQASDTISEGYIIAQEIAEGTIVDRYSSVLLTVSTGTDKIDIEGLMLAGKQDAEAKLALEDLDFVVEIYDENSDTIAKGIVLRTEPADRAPKGATVKLFVSSGPPVEMVRVPNLEGMTQEMAVSILLESKLLQGNITEVYNENITKGTVISQVIAPDMELEAGSAVDFTVSKGMAPRRYKYVASLDENCNLKSVFGPGSSTSSLRVSVRMKQTVNGQAAYTSLIEAQTITGDTIIPLKFDHIEGAENVLTGEVEVVDEDSGRILKSYNINFFKQEVIGE